MDISIINHKIEKVKGITSSSLDNIETSRHNYITIYCASCGFPVQINLRCGDRTCPECRQRDYFRLLYAYEPFIKQKNNLRLLTLTLLKDRSHFLSRSRVLFLRQCWVKLIHLPFYRRLLIGGLYVIEVKNKGWGWNIHIHILYEGLYIDQAKLSEDWSKLTGGSFIVFIEKVWSPVSALKYLLKYLLKSPEVSGFEKQYNSVFAGLRLISSFGTWYRSITKVKEPFKCPLCGCANWISEYELSNLCWLANHSPPIKGL